MTAETPRPIYSASATSTNTSNEAALRGASLAFSKPPVKPKPRISDTYIGNNGALVAATIANGPSRPTGTRHPSMNGWRAEEHRLRYQMTGGSNASGYTSDLDGFQLKLDDLNHGGNGYLQSPGPGPDKSQSPSFIAATLAASRSTSVTPNHTGQQQLSPATLKRHSSFTKRSAARSPGSFKSLSSKESDECILDLSSTPPTTSLIGLFEQNAIQQRGEASVRRSAPSATVRPRPSPNRSSPIRFRSPEPMITKTSQPPEIKSPKPSFAPPIPSNPQQSVASKTPPPARKPSPTTSRPIPILLKSQQPGPQDEDDNVSSDDSFVSASDYKLSWRAALQNQSRRLTTNSIHSHNTVDSLANAIVASSLASSRAASPSRSLQSHPPPPPPRRSPHKHLFHSRKETSRTPSPAKQQGHLRMTLRKPKGDEDIDEGEVRRKKKPHLMKKHPNKHHEGDRKRWRDEITERERKRYEAVWASNKGLHTDPGFESNVCSLVVRDVFSRSRLSSDVLEEVYALIDRKQNGTLERDEFVVGLWLIDQRLKGRKLPIRVSESVWRSVGISRGIKVRKMK